MRTVREIAVAFVLPIGLCLVLVAGFAVANGAVPPVGKTLFVLALVDTVALLATSWPVRGDRR